LKEFWISKHLCILDVDIRIGVSFLIEWKRSIKSHSKLHLNNEKKWVALAFSKVVP